MGQLLHPKQFGGIAYGIDAEEERIEEREDHGDKRQSQSDSGDDGASREGSAAEAAQPVEDIARRGVEERGAALVAALIGRERHGAKACPRLRAGLRSREAAFDERLRFAFQMEGELLVELPLHVAGGQQRSSAELQVPQIHRQASFITRPIAAAIRSHSRHSMASCFRPDAVRR